MAEAKRHEGKREDGGRGRELAQMEIAVPQQDVLSPTLHMSSPILSTRVWAAGDESGSTSAMAQPRSSVFPTSLGNQVIDCGLPTQ